MTDTRLEVPTTSGQHAPAEPPAPRGPWLSRYQFENVGIVVLLAGLITYFWTSNSHFATTSNLLAILTSSVVIGLISLGQAGLMIGGGFDLSVGGAIPLGAILFVKLSNGGMPAIPAVLLTVVGIGLVVGIANGVAVVKIGINPLIATLATLSIASGIANTVGNGLTVPLTHPTAAILGETSIGKIPDYLWLVAALFIVAAFGLRKTTVGRAIYVMGGNREAARLAGIRVDVLTISLYVISAGFAALAGCIEVSQLLAASTAEATSTTLLSITAVVLGGGSLLGGQGGAMGTLSGVFVLGVLANGLAINAVPTFYGDIVDGGVLLLAVGISALRIRHKNR